MMEQAGGKQARERIDDIEILRAAAIVFVMIQHVPLNLVIGSAWLAGLFEAVGFEHGVDLFLAVSGFVIARSLLPSLEDDRVSKSIVLQRFYLRRMFRLWPAAWLWLALILAAAGFMRHDILYGNVHTNLWATLAGLTHLANLRFAALWGRATYGASFAYWSLSLEEQFYLLLPLLALWCGRRLPVLLGLAILIQFPIERGVWLQAFRVDALAWGVLLAIWSRRPSYRRCEPRFLGRHRHWQPVLCGLLLAALARLGAGIGVLDQFRIGLVALVAIILVWLASYDRGYVSGGPLTRVLLWFGSRSYALYLVHVPIYMIARSALQAMLPAAVYGPVPAFWLAPAAGLPATLLLADLTYRLVERPMRRLGRLLSSGAAPAPLPC